MSGAELERLITEKANLRLDSGTMFGKASKGVERFNAACPRAILEKAPEQLKRAVQNN